MMTARAFIHVVGIAALLTSRFSVIVADTSFDTVEECNTEATSCDSDSTCIQCFDDLVEMFHSTTTSYSTTAENIECIRANLDEDTSVTTCDKFGVIECCYSDDCFANDAFSNLWECFVEGQGCPTENFSCDETSTASTTATAGAAGFSHLVCVIVLVFTSFRMGF